jgi:hypothetical protein
MSPMDTSEAFSGPVLPWVSGLPPEIWTLVAEQVRISQYGGKLDV